MTLIRIIGGVLVAASFVYLAMAISKYAAALPPIAWNAAAMAAIGGAVLLYMSQFAVSGLAWHLWLAGIGEPTRLQRSVVIVMLSQIVKYVPGSIAQHIARVALAKRAGISTAGTVLSIGLEIGWSLAAATGIALATATFLSEPLLKSDMMPASVTVLTVLIALIAVPSIGIWLLGQHHPRFVNKLLGDGGLRHPAIGTMLTCFALYGINHVICGAILSLLAQALFGVPSAYLLQSIGVFALAWLAGLVVVVAPGGIGVRESILIAGLSPIYGPGAALGVAIAYRIISSVGDGLGFALAHLLNRYLARPSA